MSARCTRLGIFAASLLAMLTAAVTVFARHDLRLALSDSAVPVGVYRFTSLHGPPRRGQLVGACLPLTLSVVALDRGYVDASSRSECPAGVPPVGKLALGLPGDTLEVEPDGVTINGRRFVNSASAERDSRGRPLDHVPWGVRHVNAGEVWLFGFNDAHSWDSRYYGPLPLAAVRWVVRPVLTLGASEP
jgi:conjugative transfer signal peptidase TraF